jgi:hypothetical protein
MKTIRRLKDLKIERLILYLIICNLVILKSAYGIWGLSQDLSTKGSGNVGYTGFLTLPLYLNSDARNDAIITGSDDKFRTYGGYIQYGITDQFDVGLQGNSSVNSSIGVNLKYRPAKYLTTMVGFDYIMNEMMLAPFGVLMTGAELSKNFSVYGGVKAFQWSNMIIEQLPQQQKENTFGTVIYAGLHIFRKEGWKNQVMSSLPTGLYIELGYPVNVDSKCITICLGLDGFLGLSFPNLQWH